MRARTLRVTEQQVLLDAATAYMNLLRDGAILELNRRNVEVLTEQLKQTRDRLSVGEVTRTDVAQAESRLAAGRSSLFGRAVELRADVDGELPARDRRRAGQRSLRSVLPSSTISRPAAPAAIKGAIGKVQGRQQKSPSVLAATYGVDIAELAVRVNEGSLYPQIWR